MVNETLIISGLIFLLVLVYIGILATVGVFRRNEALQVAGGEQPTHLEVTSKPRPPKPPASPESVQELPKHLKPTPWEDCIPEIIHKYIVVFKENSPSAFMVVVENMRNGSACSFKQPTELDLKRLQRFAHPNLFEFLDQHIRKESFYVYFGIIESLIRLIDKTSLDQNSSATVEWDFKTAVFDYYREYIKSHETARGALFDKQKVRKYAEKLPYWEFYPLPAMDPTLWYIGEFIRFSLYDKLLTLEDCNVKMKEAKRVAVIKRTVAKGRARAIKNRYRDPRVRLQQPPVLIEGKRK